jgi:hypothetical protein
MPDYFYLLMLGLKELNNIVMGQWPCRPEYKRSPAFWEQFRIQFSTFLSIFFKDVTYLSL